MDWTRILPFATCCHSLSLSLSPLKYHHRNFHYHCHLEDVIIVRFILTIITHVSATMVPILLFHNPSSHSLQDRAKNRARWNLLLGGLEFNINMCESSSSLMTSASSSLQYHSKTGFKRWNLLLGGFEPNNMCESSSSSASKSLQYHSKTGFTRWNLLLSGLGRNDF